MAGTAAKRPVGRPRDPAKTEAILDAAWALFIERGFEAVPMEAVAVRAGVLKKTLYSSFADRTALFEAAMLREMERIEAAQRLAPAGEPEEPFIATLRAFGIGIMSFLASDVAVGFYGPLSAEIRRHPALSRAFWNLAPDGPARTWRASWLLPPSAATSPLMIRSLRPTRCSACGWASASLSSRWRVGARRCGSVAERVDRGITLLMRAHGATRP